MIDDDRIPAPVCDRDEHLERIARESKARIRSKFARDVKRDRDRAVSTLPDRYHAHMALQRTGQGG